MFFFLYLHLSMIKFKLLSLFYFICIQRDFQKDTFSRWRVPTPIYNQFMSHDPKVG